jgi:hypothetical protein
MNNESISVLVGAVTLGILQALSLWRQQRNADQVHSKLKEVVGAQEVIKRVLNGPMGIALTKLAGAKEEVARLTMDPKDLASASEARARSDEHEEIRVGLEKQEAIKAAAAEADTKPTL